MIIVHAESAELLSVITDTLQLMIKDPYFNSEILRINGEFDLNDKEKVLDKMQELGIPVRECEVYSSVIPEENRMELIVSLRDRR